VRTSQPSTSLRKEPGTFRSLQRRTLRVLVAVQISALSRRAGRRAGLTTALAIAALGAMGVVAAGALDSFALLLAASAVFGAGNAAVMLAR